LEISGRKGHCFTNGHIVKLAKKYEAPLVINSDAHAPSDLLTKEMALKIGIGAGLTQTEVEAIWKKTKERFV
ncbi:MAG: PHP domain-containing protein, partial [Thermodesulfobacteriota bacterium]